MSKNNRKKRNFMQNSVIKNTDQNVNIELFRSRIQKLNEEVKKQNNRCNSALIILLFFFIFLLISLFISSNTFLFFSLLFLYCFVIVLRNNRFRKAITRKKIKGDKLKIFLFDN